jgi:hypothetical protein
VGVQPFDRPLDLAPQGRLKLGLGQHAHEQPFQAIDTICISPHQPVQVLEIGPLSPTMATLPLRIAHAHAVTLRRGSRLSKLATAFAGASAASYLALSLERSWRCSWLARR